MRRRWDVFGMGLAGVLVGLLVATVLPAAATNGDPVRVGEVHSGQKATVLRSPGLRALKVVSLRSDGTPLELVAEPGRPPLKVNSTVKVRKLNADLLDGLDSSELVPSFDYGPWFAAVTSTGTLSRGSRVSSTSRTSTGLYVVAFDRSASSCVYIATLYSAASVGGDTVTTAGSSGSVQVTVRSGAGDLKDANFYLHMVCPLPTVPSDQPFEGTGDGF